MLTPVFGTVINLYDAANPEVRVPSYSRVGDQDKPSYGANRAMANSEAETNQAAAYTELW